MKKNASIVCLGFKWTCWKPIIFLIDDKGSLINILGRIRNARTTSSPTKSSVFSFFELIIQLNNF